MNNIIHRAVQDVEQRLILLAPTSRHIPATFQCVASADYERRLADVQGLRGQVYIQDGAIQPQALSATGLYETPEDREAWHLALLTGDVIEACGWYVEYSHSVQYHQLRVARTPLAQSSYGHLLNQAVEQEIAEARSVGYGFAEIGGWAITENARCASNGLLLVLAGYAFSLVMGGALGLTTATVRHKSSSILRRLGGASLSVGDVIIPTYYDDRYRCEMEILQFDSRRLNPKYADLIMQIAQKLPSVRVMTAKS